MLAELSLRSGNSASHILSTWSRYDFELVKLLRYSIPSDELEFFARLHATEQFFWKMGLPSAFSWLKVAWKKDAWLASASRATGFFRNLINGLLSGKGKKK